MSGTLRHLQEGFWCTRFSLTWISDSPWNRPEREPLFYLGCWTTHPCLFFLLSELVLYFTNLLLPDSPSNAVYFKLIARSKEMVQYRWIQGWKFFSRHQSSFVLFCLWKHVKTDHSVYLNQVSTLSKCICKVFAYLC